MEEQGRLALHTFSLSLYNVKLPCVSTNCQCVPSFSLLPRGFSQRRSAGRSRLPPDPPFSNATKRPRRETVPVHCKYLLANDSGAPSELICADSIISYDDLRHYFSNEK